MTICVSVKVGEGLVMAADSMTMLQGLQRQASGYPQQVIIQTYEYANKVARIKDYPIGLMSWGIGGIGDRSIQSLLMEFEHNFKPLAENEDYTVKSVADDFLGFIKSAYERQFHGQPIRPPLGVFIGGFSYRSFFSDIFIYEFPKSTDWATRRGGLPNGKQDFGVDWFGITQPLVRLVKGVEPQFLSELVKQGCDRSVIEKVLASNIAEWGIPHDGMPLQDAIDLAKFFISVATGWSRFGVGAPACGGPTDIAVITPGNFTWAQRKQWAIKE